MKRLAWLLGAAALASCGGVGTTTATTGGGHGGATGTTSSSGGAGGQGGATSSSSSSSGAVPCGGGCPTGYTCGTANGLDVCRAASGVPLFSTVTVIMMENTSLATLQLAYDAGTAPNLKALRDSYATGADYHGVAHPSLPNYIALTSGDTQNIGCDCKGEMGHGSCNAVTCNLFLGSCSCDKDVMHLGDQLEAAQKTWMAFGEDMGTACNLTDSGNYAVRHVPFLYYDNVQTNAARCGAHVVDFSAWNPASPADFNFIAPNLVDDMHDPNLPSDNTAVMQNIPNGDMWIGPTVDAILASPAYQKGGLLVIAWDEDDDSGGISGTNDPVGIFVISPFAKHGGYVSQPKADHYALLATIDDGLGLPRLGRAASVSPLVDYFPDN